MIGFKQQTSWLAKTSKRTNLYIYQPKCIIGICIVDLRLKLNGFTQNRILHKNEKMAIVFLHHNPQQQQQQQQN